MKQADVLVVSSYPPIPLPSAAAGVEAVRQAWAEGLEPFVVSPRLSAADVSVRICGPLAGVRLDRMRRLTSCRRLVLIVERGCPVPDGTWPEQIATAVGLRWAMHRFEHVTVIRVGATATPPPVTARILAGAHRVLERSADPTPLGVTPLGPEEVSPSERPGELAEKVARRVLGRHAGRARTVAGRLRRGFRS